MELEEADIIWIWKAASKVEQFLKFDELHNFGYVHHNQPSNNHEEHRNYETVKILYLMAKVFPLKSM